MAELLLGRNADIEAKVKNPYERLVRDACKVHRFVDQFNPDFNADVDASGYNPNPARTLIAA